MPAGQLHRLIDNVRRAALLPERDRATDGALLTAFVAQRDESAFAALVRQHGPMVLGVCRRVLGNVHDAEDAFQAAFLVLARKAASVVPREMVGNWLYGVAYRTALHAKRTAARRGVHEKQVQDMPHPQAAPAGFAENADDLHDALDRELHALPSHYRLPIVLCDLEGRTRREVARQLKVPDGTLSNRLSAGRKMLARRLTRRGITLSASGVAAALAQQAAAESVPDALAVVTVKAAGAFAAGQAAASVVPAGVAALTAGVLRTMLLTKIKAAGALLAVCLLGLVLAGWGRALSAGGPKADAQPQPALATKPAQPAGAGARDWKAEFQRLYALKDGEVLKRIAPPYHECRAKVFDEKGKVEPPAFFIDTDQTYLFFRFQAGKTRYGTSYGYGPKVENPPPPAKLSFILERGLSFPLPQVEAAGDLLDTTIHGEFVFRTGTPPEAWAPALDKILRAECQLPIRLALRELERDVIVVSGNYQAKPRKGQRKNTVLLSPGDAVDDWSGSGIGSFDDLLEFVSNFLGKHVVSDLPKPPPGQFWWRHRSGLTTNILGRTVYTEYPNADATLRSLAEQTGLVFTAGKRTVKVLVVEKGD